MRMTISPRNPMMDEEAEEDSTMEKSKKKKGKRGVLFARISYTGDTGVSSMRSGSVLKLLIQ
jgi:hypothetical protein